ncbi:MAG: hypothetical protein AAF481_01595 [Acidobacteriota bacterium]
MTDHAILEPFVDPSMPKSSSLGVRWSAKKRRLLERRRMTWLSGVWILAGVEILVALWLRAVLPWTVDHFGLVALEPLPLVSVAKVLCLVHLMAIFALWLGYRAHRRHPIPYLAAALVLVATAAMVVTLAPHFAGDSMAWREVVMDDGSPP